MLPHWPSTRGRESRKCWRPYEHWESSQTSGGLGSWGTDRGRASALWSCCSRGLMAELRLWSHSRTSWALLACKSLRMWPLVQLGEASQRGSKGGCVVSSSLASPPVDSTWVLGFLLLPLFIVLKEGELSRFHHKIYLWSLLVWMRWVLVVGPRRQVLFYGRKMKERKWLPL